MRVRPCASPRRTSYRARVLSRWSSTAPRFRTAPPSSATSLTPTSPTSSPGRASWGKGYSHYMNMNPTRASSGITWTWAGVCSFLLICVQILVRLDCFSHSITMEVWKPARWKTVEIHRNEHTPVHPYLRTVHTARRSFDVCGHVMRTVALNVNQSMSSTFYCLRHSYWSESECEYIMAPVHV